jgi:hypothetical protein
MTVTNVTPPVISGTARQGLALQTSNGTWTYDLDYLTYLYQWMRCDAAGANCVDIAGATAASYTLTAADVGSRIRSEVTATEADFPPAPAGTLTWEPPGYPAYAGYQARTISNSSYEHIVAENLNVDAVFDWTEVVDQRVVIQGFRNVVIIGGELHYQTVRSSQHEMMRITRCGGTEGGGIVHIEGVKIHTPLNVGTDCIVLMSGRTLASGKNGAVLQLENCYLKNGWGSGQGASVHADNVQLWGMPSGAPAGYAGGIGQVRMDRVTGYTVQQAIYFWNRDGALENVDIRNSNFSGFGAQTGQVGPNKAWRVDLYNRPSTATYTNVWVNDTATAQLSILKHFIPNDQGTYYGGPPDMTRACTLGTDASGQFVDWVSTADINGVVRWGIPPGGDFCPSSTAGVSYVSPGYV